MKMADVINADLDMAHDTQMFQLGAKYTEDRNSFRYVQYNEGDGAVDGVAGRLVIGLDSGYPDWEVSMDYSTAVITGIPNDPRGMLQVALTDGQFGWAQTGGRNRVAGIAGAGAVAQGAILMKHAATDGAIDTWAAGKRVGVALEAKGAANAMAIGTMRIELEDTE
jgi:hypothetical protein